MVFSFVNLTNGGAVPLATAWSLGRAWSWFGYNGATDRLHLHELLLLPTLFRIFLPKKKLQTECDISSRDFSVSRLCSFFESIGLGLKNFGLEKKSWYRSRKYLVSKKGLGISLESIWSKKKVSVLVSKTLVSKKVSISVSKIFVSKKSQ